MVTGTSVIGITFDKGVMIAADILGSYGSMAKLRNLPRIFKVNDKSVIGGHGDYADFQYLCDLIEAKV
jgi:20S proteasome subunit beta 7